MEEAHSTYQEILNSVTTEAIHADFTNAAADSAGADSVGADTAESAGGDTFTDAQSDISNNSNSKDDSSASDAAAAAATAQLRSEIDDDGYEVSSFSSFLVKCAINLVLPFFNGVMLGFGEIFAHEVGYKYGWLGAKVSPERRMTQKPDSSVLSRPSTQQSPQPSPKAAGSST